MVVLVYGCAEAVQEQKSPDMPLNFTTYVVDSGQGMAEQAGTGQFKSFNIRSMDSGFSPDAIKVKEGDTVGMFVTYTGTADAGTFSINGYASEEFYHSGNIIYIEFVADRKGEFDFGDDRTEGVKGRLIVS